MSNSTICTTSPGSKSSNIFLSPSELGVALTFNSTYVVPSISIFFPESPQDAKNKIPTIKIAVFSSFLCFLVYLFSN